MKREEAAYAAHCEPVVTFEYPREGDDSQDDVDVRQIQIRALEFMAKMLLTARTEQVRHMRASVCLAILHGDLNLSSIASHFGVTTQRVGQIVKEIRQLETLAHP